ncbi:MAG: hypothetical protein ABW364_09585 [Rhodococcus fascians]
MLSTELLDVDVSTASITRSCTVFEEIERSAVVVIHAPTEASEEVDYVGNASSGVFPRPIPLVNNVLRGPNRSLDAVLTWEIAHTRAFMCRWMTSGTAAPFR